MDVQQQVVEMCLAVIEMEADEIDLDDEFQSFSHIDSLKALDILTAIEQHFKIKIPEKELREFRTINRVVDVANRYVTAAAPPAA